MLRPHGLDQRDELGLRARAGQDVASGILDQLADLFLERHPGKEVADTILDGRGGGGAGDRKEGQQAEAGKNRWRFMEERRKAQGVRVRVTGWPSRPVVSTVPVSVTSWTTTERDGRGREPARGST